MFKPSKAFVTDDGAFVYVEKKSGGYAAFINFDALIDGLPKRVDASALHSRQLDSKIELLEYLRKQK